MIPETVIRPKPQNRIAYSVFFGALGAALLALAFSYTVDRFHGWFQLAAVAFGVCAILVYSRYVGSFYTYEIAKDAAGLPLFLVRQQTGKRVSILCRVSLADLTDVRRETRAEAKANKLPAGTKLYTYTPSIAPASSVRLTIDSRYEHAQIRVEITDECIDLLRSAAEQGKLLAGEDDE